MMMKISCLLLIAVAYCEMPEGIDVSGYQGIINWNSVKANGVEFAYIKATEGTTFRSSAFKSQYDGAANVGLIHGAYHFAQPSSSSGAEQANFFCGWRPDNMTLPGALDIEYTQTKERLTRRYPVIYTTTNWWKECTGNAAGFQNNNPLWIARWGPVIGELPAGYRFATFWQYDDSGRNPGDPDRFIGDSAGLARFARGD
ncbi:MAG: glycoside hydrolase family 25 protein, partial [Benniella sp.]